jgi:multiple sugar transport system permease protein
MYKTKKAYNLFIIFIIILLVIWSTFPIYWNAITSIKTRGDIFSLEPKFFFTPNYDAMKTAFSPGSSSVYKYLTNSLVVSIGSTICTLVVAIMAAYSLSKKRFRYKGILWILILATRLLPPISTIVPLFLIASKFKLVDTYLLLICINVALNLPFSIWLLKSFFDSIPTEVQEASIVDGCTGLQSIWYIILPLAAPGIATAATFIFIQAWNEFTFAFIFSSSQVRTLPVLIAQARGDDIFLWQDMAARTTIQMIPALLLGLYLQKHLVGGLTTGSIK